MIFRAPDGGEGPSLPLCHLQQTYVLRPSVFCTCCCPRHFTGQASSICISLNTLILQVYTQQIFTLWACSSFLQPQVSKVFRYPHKHNTVMSATAVVHSLVAISDLSCSDCCDKTLTKSSMEIKGLFLLHLSDIRPSMKEVRTRTWREELKQKHGKALLTHLFPMACSAYLFISLTTTFPGVVLQ